MDHVLTAPAAKEGVIHVVPSLQPMFLPTAAPLCTTPAEPKLPGALGLLEGCGKWHNSGKTTVERYQELGTLCSKRCTSVVFQVNGENIQP